MQFGRVNNAMPDAIAYDFMLLLCIFIPISKA